MEDEVLEYMRCFYKMMDNIDCIIISIDGFFDLDKIWEWVDFCIEMIMVG